MYKTGIVTGIVTGVFDPLKSADYCNNLGGVTIPKKGITITEVQYTQSVAETAPPLCNWHIAYLHTHVEGCTNRKQGGFTIPPVVFDVRL
jgi:hypothetical protein